MGMAAIQRVRVRVQAEADPKGLEELGLWGRDETTASCLLYPRKALEIDGGIAVRLMSILVPKLPEPHGVFGTFRDVGEWRLHLLFPNRLAATSSLRVWDWKVLEVTEESVVKLEARVK